MRKYLLAAALPVITIIVMLQGCNQSSECPEIIYDDISGVKNTKESYTCRNTKGTDTLEFTWCTAKEKFEIRGHSKNPNDFMNYLKGFREGYSHAHQAEDSKVELHDLSNQSEPAHTLGYRDGYVTLAEAMGVFMYNCDDDDRDSEYKDRWCEAADAYRKNGSGSANNPFIRGRFVDGYMTGGRVALTVQTSMEEFFGGEIPEGKRPAIAQPSSNVKNIEHAFYIGFDVGYKAIIDSIKESINQVMQQMEQIQLPNNIDFPGALPPSPAQ